MTNDGACRVRTGRATPSDMACGRSERLASASVVSPRRYCSRSPARVSVACCTADILLKDLSRLTERFFDPDSAIFLSPVGWACFLGANRCAKKVLSFNVGRLGITDCPFIYLVFQGCVLADHGITSRVVPAVMVGWDHPDGQAGITLLGCGADAYHRSSVIGVEPKSV